MTTAREIVEYMESLFNENVRQGMLRFFKTGPGDYGEGDEFLGIKSPQVREIVKHVSRGFLLDEVPELLMSRWHEVRLCGFLILVDKFERLATKRLEQDEQAIKKRDEIVTLYLQYAERANNWDLVDLSVYKILGHWLMLPTFLGKDIISKDLKDSKDNYQILTLSESLDYKIEVLDSLAKSDCLWKQRMSVVCTWYPSHHDDPSWCLRYAEIHLHHPHDLMHKAVGWMLREMGKSYIELLRTFLRQHAHEMPRTMLRYAIEKLPETERKEWLAVPYDRFV
jgi:3-methyladenine DNA glycosylase AlkD